MSRYTSSSITMRRALCSVFCIRNVKCCDINTPPTATTPFFTGTRTRNDDARREESSKQKDLMRLITRSCLSHFLFSDAETRIRREILKRFFCTSFQTKGLFVKFLGPCFLLLKKSTVRACFIRVSCELYAVLGNYLDFLG